MQHGNFYRGTTFVVISLVVFILTGCGGYVASGGGNGNTSYSINGTVFDSTTNKPVAGAQVVLEQPDASGTDRIIASTTSLSDGSFSFSPSSGIYDVVVDATVTAASVPTVTYAATVTFGVPANASLKIPLVPEFGNTTPTGNPATIFATVTTGGTNTSIAFINKVDVMLSALQSVSPAVGTVNQITIPTFATSTATVTTTTTQMTGTPCANGTTCSDYTLLVPEGNLSVGRFSSSGTVYTLSTQQSPVNFTVEGRAFSHGSGLVQNCIPSTISSMIGVSGGTVNSGNPNLTFTSCS